MRKGVCELGRNIEIAPSILAADFAHLAREIEKVEAAGASLIHLDVMDGHFVPNMTIGPPVVASIRKITSLPLDAHLMIEKPERFLDDFIRAGVNWLSVHVEADAHLDRTLQHLKANGIKAGIAINPGTCAEFNRSDPASCRLRVDHDSESWIWGAEIYPIQLKKS